MHPKLDSAQFPSLEVRARSTRELRVSVASQLIAQERVPSPVHHVAVKWATASSAFAMSAHLLRTPCAIRCGYWRYRWTPNSIRRSSCRSKSACDPLESCTSQSRRNALRKNACPARRITSPRNEPPRRARLRRARTISVHGRDPLWVLAPRAAKSAAASLRPLGCGRQPALRVREEIEDTNSQMTLHRAARRRGRRACDFFTGSETRGSARQRVDLPFLTGVAFHGSSGQECFG
jgi:hypothetical protein